MNENPRWPFTEITQVAFLKALRALKVKGLCRKNLEQFVTQGELKQVPADGALEAFIEAAAMPEMRLKMAAATSCTYAELTTWVIWADLLRVEGLKLTLAKALAACGVAGVQDFVMHVRDPARQKKLRQDLAAALPADIPLDLEKLCNQAAQLRSKTVTDTSVILVVKGAGNQKPNETLDAFLNGFWPAVKSIDPRSLMRQRMDILPPDYRSTVYDKEPLNVVVEIESGERRIWLREPYWDVAALPGNPISALLKEWRMATYAFGSWINELLAEKDTRQIMQPDPKPYRPAFKRFYWAFFLMYICAFFPLIFTGMTAHWSGELPAFIQDLSVWRFGAILFLVSLAISLVLAFPPARFTQRELAQYYATRQGYSPLPGMSNGVLALLLAAFLVNPWGYLIFVLFIGAVHLALLRARAMLWRYREICNSDTSTSLFYSIEGEEDGRGNPYVYKIDNASAAWRRLFVFIYRYVVVLGLPLTFLIMLIARILQWTRVLESVGTFIQNSLNVALSGVLGDVVNYALDPAQASRVRAVLESDIQFFHNLEQVNHMHVFAHSQGTPITFETLYNYLPDLYRRKIQTYVTIGSVLSYYRQCNPILDARYMPRFPVRPYPEFAAGFKWMNFWNMVDPITEFYGLDEYNLIKQAPILDRKQLKKRPLDLREDQLEQTRRFEASPTNIKTSANYHHHSEYWGNLPLVQVPLARRVLGDLRPREWNPEPLLNLRGNKPHANAVRTLWAVWTVFFLGAASLVVLRLGGLNFQGVVPVRLLELAHQQAGSLPGWGEFLLYKGVQFGAALIIIGLSVALIWVVHAILAAPMQALVHRIYGQEERQRQTAAAPVEKPKTA